jgi:6-phosphogluconolactonase (cycloisomerase 2 family)
VSRSGRTLAVANYTGGSVATYHVADDGRLAAASRDQHVGKGPNVQRQERAHAHSTDFAADDRLLLSCDLGNDRVYVYRHDSRAGTISAHKPAFVGLEPGAGPRHLALHPSGRYAYVVTELSSSVAMFAWNPGAGTLVQRQTVSTLPVGATVADNSTAEIVAHPTGRFVYVSNRGHDSIAVFSVDARNGHLTLLANTPTGGGTPRNFAVDPSGRWLLAANQRSNSIVTFAVDTSTGTLTDRSGYGRRHRSRIRFSAPDGSCTSIGRRCGSIQPISSRSARSSIAVQPAVTLAGPAQMCRKMHDPRDGRGGALYATCTPYAYWSISRMRSELAQSTRATLSRFTIVL